MRLIIRIVLGFGTKPKKLDNAFGLDVYRAKKFRMLKVYQLLGLRMRYESKLVLFIQLINNKAIFCLAV